jgi:superfamily II DNA helicase RecQ
MRGLESMDRLQAIVLDEAHLYLSPDLAEFRPVFRTLPSIFRKFNVPLIFLSGSLPPSDEVRLATLFNRGPMRTLRESCRRSNISYHIDNNTRIDWNNATSVGDYIAKNAWKTISRDGRVLVFLPTKQLITTIAQSKQWLYIHADMETVAQASVLKSWGETSQNLILLATGVIGTGTDLAAVRMVIHVGLPHSFRDWFQQTGRAGRDGLPAIALLNSTRPPFTLKPYDEDSLDYETLHTLTAEGTCRRLTIDGYMDGKASICLAGRMELCDVCESLKAECRKKLGLTPHIVDPGPIIRPSKPHDAYEEALWLEIGDTPTVIHDMSPITPQPSSSRGRRSIFPEAELSSKLHLNLTTPCLTIKIRVSSVII